MVTLSRFELAPPRRFILPAILLLVSERPAYGYGLLPQLEDLHLGHVDRPAVYRALAQLENDSLVTAHPASGRPGVPARRGGSARRVYSITSLGEAVLAEWMGVVREECEGLGAVLARYSAPGQLEEAAGGFPGSASPPMTGGFAGAGGSSPAGASSPGGVPTRSAARPRLVGPGGRQPDRPQPGGRARYRLVDGRCAVLIEVRAAVGLLSFGTFGVSGCIEAVVEGGAVVGSPSARLVVDVSGLTCGNRLHDTELLRCVDAGRYPSAVLELTSCVPTGLPARYTLAGNVTLSGATRPMQGAVTMEEGPDGDLHLTGAQALDIRDFALQPPAFPALRIRPEVQVLLQVRAEREAR